MTVPPPARTVLSLLADATARVPTGRAVADCHTSRTFAELTADVAAVRAQLVEVGVGHGDTVAIALPNSIAFVESFLAVLACGAAAHPLPAASRPAELRRLLAERPPRALVVAGDAPAATAAAAETGLLAWRGHGLRILRAAASRGAEGAPTAETPALVALSSGTVARPHLVTRTHANLWWEAENFAAATRLGPADVVLGVVPLSHAHGLGNALLAALRAHAALVLEPRFLRRATLDRLAHERVTVFPTVPFMVRMLALTDRRRRWDLAALGLCFSAGAPLAGEIYEAFHARFGVPVRQLYGLTEAGSVTLNLAPPDELDPASVGRPLGTVSVDIERADGVPAAPEEDGEVVVRSPAAEGGADHALHTRDRGHWSPRGELVLTGRTSLFINAAGNKVDPAEVEAALRLHPAVADAAVFGAPAAHGEQVVAAAVVTRGSCTAQALQNHCRGLLAPYKVPRLVSFRSALPRSPLGKVLIGRLLAET